jgi:hypothetical protein
MLQQLKDIKQLATQWPVAVGGQGARVFGDLLRDTEIELLDDLSALHSRLSILVSTRIITARGWWTADSRELGVDCLSNEPNAESQY